MNIQDIANRDSDWSALERDRIADETALYVDLRDARDNGNKHAKACAKRLLSMRSVVEPARGTDWALDHNWTWNPADRGSATHGWTAP